MKHTNFFLCLLLLMLILVNGCNKGSMNTDKQIKIFATTDVHGAIFPYDFIQGKATKTSLAGFATMVKQARAKSGQETVVLDNGDILQGQPPVYYHNVIDTATKHVCAEVMNYIGYDAVAVGNHDIEAGHRVYDKLPQQFDFPWLAANAVHEDTKEPYFRPYTIIERSGTRIAVLGLITPAIYKWLPPAIWEGIEFQDMIKAAEKWVPIIREKENPDLLLGLFHAGLDYTFDGETAQTPKNENASLLVAEQVAGFDMIIAGHDHQVEEKSILNEHGDTVHIINPGSQAKYAGVFTITPKKKGYAITSSLKSLSDYQPDSAFMEHFQPEIQEVKGYVNQQIGKFAGRFESKEALWGPSAFVDLIHRLQLQLTDAVVSFSAPLAFNTTIPEGVVTMGDMFKLYRYENLLYTFEMSGREIKDYLEFSYGHWFNTMQSPEDHLLNFKRDSAGNLVKSEYHNNYELATPYFNFSSAAGIRYTVDLRKPIGQRLTIKGFQDGSPFRMDSVYRVALNSYRGSGGGRHLTEGAGIPRDSLQERIIASTEKDLRYYLSEWIKAESPVKPEIISHWKLIPEVWARQGKSMDQELL